MFWHLSAHPLTRRGNYFHGSLPSNRLACKWALRRHSTLLTAYCWLLSVSEISFRFVGPADWLKRTLDPYSPFSAAGKLPLSDYILPRWHSIPAPAAPPPGTSLSHGHIPIPIPIRIHIHIQARIHTRRASIKTGHHKKMASIGDALAWQIAELLRAVKSENNGWLLNCWPNALSGTVRVCESPVPKSWIQSTKLVVFGCRLDFWLALKNDKTVISGNFMRWN